GASPAIRFPALIPPPPHRGGAKIVEDPASEVDRRYHDAIARGQQCIFLSFSPPHLTTLGLDCPTVPVFAWEFSSMPNETWWQDRPEMDWQIGRASCRERVGGTVVTEAVIAQSA